jgi:hypothetical protein
MNVFNSCFHHGYLWERHCSYCGGGSTGDLLQHEGRYISVSFRHRGIPDFVVMETGVVLTNGKSGIVEKGGNRLTIV